MSHTSSNDGRHELLFQVDWMIIITLIGTLLAGLGAIAVYIYYLRKGQFEDVEDIKYQLFRDEENRE